MTMTKAGATSRPLWRLATTVIMFLMTSITPTATILLAVAAAADVTVVSTGKPHDHVVELTQENFDATVNRDPANAFWLLKFYAPWCGHCKHLAPVLDKVAPFLTGKMAIGKIDCTVHKRLCDLHGVRGYPTLKFVMDGGEVHDYPGGRKADEIIDFAEKMNRPAVELLASIEKLQELFQQQQPALLSKSDGVAFVAYHPALQRKEAGETTSETEEMAATTRLTAAFAQAARKLKAYGTFFLLEPESPDAMTLLSNNNPEQQPEAVPYICRVEDGVAPRCMDSSLFVGGDNDNNIQLETVLDFVRQHNVATVTALGPNNFHKLGRQGRPLVIAIVGDADNKPEQVATAKLHLTSYATTGNKAIRSLYYFGWMNGKQWGRFLEQFSVVPQADKVQLLVLNVPKKQYYYNETYTIDRLDEFLQDIADGKLVRETAGKKGMEGAFLSAVDWIEDNRPWSVAALVIVVLLALALCISCIDPGEDLRPPYPHGAPASEVAALRRTNQKTTTTAPKDSVKNQEPQEDTADSKKDK